MDGITILGLPINIQVGQGIRLRVFPEFGNEPATYEIVQPAFGQDDGMGGNIIIRCVDKNDAGEPETLAYIGMNDITDDFGEGRDTGEGKGEFLGESPDELPGAVVGFWGVPFVRIAPTTL